MKLRPRLLPPQNYAREIMELFTIGLCRLNSDGTQVRDPSTGQCMQTYDNDAIMTFARAWTGFYPPAARGNIEAVTGDGAVNRIDPMRIDATWRDA